MGLQQAHLPEGCQPARTDKGWGGFAQAPHPEPHCAECSAGDPDDALPGRARASGPLPCPLPRRWGIKHSAVGVTAQAQASLPRGVESLGCATRDGSPEGPAKSHGESLLLADDKSAPPTPPDCTALPSIYGGGVAPHNTGGECQRQERLGAPGQRALSSGSQHSWVATEPI